jgi:NAD+ kinase
MTAFATIALIGKYNSPEIAEPLLRLARFVEKRGARVLLDRLTASHVGPGEFEVLPLEEIGKRAGLAIVLGGDGTMLNIARTFAPFDVALIGVNQGRLGFLTDVALDTMFETIGDILDGHYLTEARMLLSATIHSPERPDAGADAAAGPRYDVLAFNDVVVSKGAKGSMVEFDVHIDGQFVYTQRSDGVIIATPTGSTAYALSAGGPILHPGLSAIALVPVSPHTLSARPITVGADSRIEVRLLNGADALAHFDNHSHFTLHNGDRIVVRRYEHAIRLLHPVGYSYYHMLRQKLHWSEPN